MPCRVSRLTTEGVGEAQRAAAGGPYRGRGMHRGQRGAVQGGGAGNQLQCLLCRCGAPACLSKLQHHSTSFLENIETESLQSLHFCIAFALQLHQTFCMKDAVCSISQNLFPARLKSSLQVLQQTGASLAHLVPLVGQTNFGMLSWLLALARCGYTGGIGFIDDVSQNNQCQSNHIFCL